MKKEEAKMGVVKGCAKVEKYSVVAAADVADKKCCFAFFCFCQYEGKKTRRNGS